MNKDIFERIRLYKINYKRIKLEKEKKQVKAKGIVYITHKKQSKIKIFFKLLVGIFASFFSYFANKSNKKNFSNEVKADNKSNKNVNNIKVYGKNKEKLKNYELVKNKQVDITNKINKSQDNVKNIKVELSIVEDQIMYANSLDDLEKAKIKIYKLKDNFKNNINDVKKNNDLINEYSKMNKNEVDFDIESKKADNQKNEDESLKIMKRIDEDFELIELKKKYIIQEEKLEEQLSLPDNELNVEEDYAKVKQVGILIYNYVNKADKFDDKLVKFNQEKFLSNQVEKTDEKIKEKVLANSDKIKNEKNLNSDFDRFIEMNVVGISNEIDKKYDEVENEDINEEVEDKKVGIAAAINSEKAKKEENKEKKDNKEKKEEKEEEEDKAVSEQKWFELRESVDLINSTTDSILNQIDNSISYNDRLAYYLNHPHDALSIIAYMDIMLTDVLQVAFNIGAATNPTHNRLGLMAGTLAVNELLNRHKRNVYYNDIQDNLNSMYHDSIDCINEGVRLCEESSSRIYQFKELFNSLPPEIKETAKFKSVILKCDSIERTNEKYRERLNNILVRSGNLRILVNEREG